MKYTATLKTLKEITGSDYIKDVMYTTLHGEYSYRTLFEDRGGKIVNLESVEECRLGLHKIQLNSLNSCYPFFIPSVWLKDIQPVKGPVDWTKVKKDTKILVCANGSVFKERRYFAFYRNGQVYAYVDGNTSWSSNNNTSRWDNAELVEEG